MPSVGVYTNMSPNVFVSIQGYLIPSAQLPAARTGAAVAPGAGMKGPR